MTGWREGNKRPQGKNAFDGVKLKRFETLTKAVREMLR